MSDPKETNPSALHKAASSTATEHRAVILDPVVLEHKRRRRKYTRGMRTSQELERGLVRASSAWADAFSAMFDSYKSRSRRSSYRKRDGAVRDALRNWTRATSKGMKKAADAPYELVRTVDRDRMSRRVRDALKMAAPPMFR